MSAETMIDPVIWGEIVALAPPEERASFLGELVTMLVDMVPGLFADIRAAIEAKDAKRLRNSAHKLKGASGNLGARELAQLCEGLEATAHAGGVPSDLAVMAQLDDVFAKTRAELEKLCKL